MIKSAGDVVGFIAVILSLGTAILQAGLRLEILLAV
jgi:hypothetical protein